MTTRLPWAALGAFAGLTLAWFLCGLLTGGDYFAGGSAVPIVFAPAGAGLGGWAGWRSRARTGRAVIAGGALASLLFWVAVPDGWWASPPPPRASSAPAR